MAPRPEDMDYESGETTPLTASAGRKDSDYNDSLDLHDGSSVPKKKSTKTILIAAGVAGVAVVAAVAIFKIHGGDSTSSGSGDRFGVYTTTGKHSSLSSSSTSTYKSMFSLSPEDDFDMFGVERGSGSDPSSVWGDVPGPYPTNSWYLNLVSHKASQQPDDMTSAYTFPYIVDTAPANDIAGIRLHWPVVKTGETNVQMVDDFKNGVSLGTYLPHGKNKTYHVDDESGLSHLGLSLKWGPLQERQMVAHIVRGMPYATMIYNTSSSDLLPAFHSYNAPSSPLIVDGTQKVDCGKSGKGTTRHATKEIELLFHNSDFTWALFFSKPVSFACEVIGDDINVASFSLNVTEVGSGDEQEARDEPLVVRLALLDECTTGKSNIQQHCSQKKKWSNHEKYIKMLKARANVFPTNPSIHFQYPTVIDDAKKEKTVNMTVDWKPKSTSSLNSTSSSSSSSEELIMFALPHHQHDLGNSTTDICVPTFLGRTCLVEGSTWSLSEDISSPIEFVASRPPDAKIIPDLAKSLKDDIRYQLSDNVMRGAADTYFPGKVLARVGRVIAIASELKTLSEGDVEKVLALYNDDVPEDAISASMEAASSVSLPTDKEIQSSVEMLKKAVDIWLSPESEALFVYDKSWGGLVNCGCKYSTKDSHGHCKNTYPVCPALEDVNENFGNGFYNDHHFHYGYHVYAAAVVAAHDPEWAAESFDSILLYIRDFANPSEDDPYFPSYRQKDWFLGSSWAAGIISGENSPHGRNQESSSEAIAAYEAVAVYGSTMVRVFEEADASSSQLEQAKAVQNAGQLLTLTEVRAANRYWHVWSSDEHTNIYPSGYKRLVVGMLYETMASFQTWFGPEPIFSYGIQLIPLTPIGEYRDDPVWASELYPEYVKSCKQAGKLCTDNGWSIPQAGLAATIGNKDEAVKQALEVPEEIFAHEGAVGNSLTNTLWYIATRKPFDNSNSTSANSNTTSTR